MRARGDVGFAALDARQAIERGKTAIKHSVPRAGLELSVIRRCLGDEAAPSVLVFSESEYESAVAIFPEASVVLAKSPPGWILSRDAPPKKIPNP
jgi:hypothetical protein